jgi:hypothetical protein
LFAYFHLILFSHVLQCTFHFHWFDFLQSKLNFHFDLTPLFSTIILPYPKGKIKNKYVFCQLYENQAIERFFLKICNLLKKYTWMQLCKWNVMCKSEMQCV